MGLVLALAPLLVLRTSWAAEFSLGSAGLVLADQVRLPWRWAAGKPWGLAAPAAVAAAAGPMTVAVLRDAPYAPLGALAVGVLGYAYLALADLGNRRPSPAWLSTVGLIALGGGGLAALVLLGAALAPTLPGWAVVGALLALLAAAVLALE